MGPAARLILALLCTLAVHGAPAAENEREAARLFEDALVRFEDGDTPGAVIQLKNVVKLAPKNRPARILLARAYLREGQGAAAEHQLIFARDLGADESLIVLPLAEAYIAQRKFNEVIIGLRYSGYRPEVEFRLRLHQGTAFTALGQYDRALAAFREAGALDPAAAEPLAGEAMVMLRQGQLALARAKARAALKLDPASAAAWNATASATHATGELETAAEQYGKVLLADERHLPARIARAAIYLDLGRDDAAAKDLDYLRTEFPFEPRAAYLQSVLLKRQGDEKGATASLNESAQLLASLDADVLQSQQNLMMLGGVANFSLAAFEQSEKYLEQYLAAKPTDPGARRLLGAIYLKRGWNDQVVDVLAPVLESSPHDPRVLAMLAEAEKRRGKLAAAVSLLERAVEASRDDAGLRTTLAMLYLQQGRQREALQGLSAVFEQKPADLRAGITLATLLMSRGDPAGAITVTGRLLEHHPDHLIVLNLLGSAQVRSGETERGRLTFERTVALDRTYLPARLNLGKIEVLEGRPDLAAKRYAQILMEHPGHILTMIELAGIEDQAGRLEEAIHWLEKARSTNERSLVVIAHLVDVYLRAGKADVALEAAKTAEEFAPDSPGVLTMLVRSYLAMKEPVQAQAVLKRLVPLAGYDTKRLRRIAALQREAGAWEDAVWSLRKAVQGEPHLIPARVELIEALLARGQPVEALELARALQQDAPDHPGGYGTMGEALRALGRDKDALVEFGRALEKAESDFAAVRYFVALVRAGDAGADRWAEQWVEKHPRHARMRRALAERYLLAGDYPRARVEYETLAAAQPEDPNVLNNLAATLQRLGDPRALEAALRAHAASPDSAVVNDTLGWQLVLEGNIAEGLRYLRNAATRSGEDPEVRYHIAVALEKLNRPSEARKELELAFSLGQDWHGAEEARRLLERLPP